MDLCESGFVPHGWFRDLARARVRDELTPYKWPGPPFNSFSVRLVSRSMQRRHNLIYSFECVRDSVFRSTFGCDEYLPLPPYPGLKYPGAVVMERMSEFGSDSTAFVTDRCTVTVEWGQNAPKATIYLRGDDVPVYADVEAESYVVAGAGCIHTTKFDDKAIHTGLGEKACKIKKKAGSNTILTPEPGIMYRLQRAKSNSSPKADPHSKHLPILVAMTPRCCVAILSTSLNHSSWVLGRHGQARSYSKSYQQFQGGIEEYIIVGDSFGEVCQIYAETFGITPARIPRYMMGAIAGGQAYDASQAPPASVALLRLIKWYEEVECPLSVIQLASGWMESEFSDNGDRHVFRWNRHRFGDIHAFIEECHGLGVRVLINIKPFIEASHLAYEDLKRLGGLLVPKQSGLLPCTYYHSTYGRPRRNGHFLDLTSECGSQFWFDGVAMLAAHKIDGFWIDDNHYLACNPGLSCKVDKRLRKSSCTRQRELGLWGHGLQAQLSAKIASQAAKLYRPNVRPMVLTRSATFATSCHAPSTCSDTRLTSWKNLRTLVKMAISAGFSLLPWAGQDIGNFEGELNEELFMRRLQLALYSPRFAFNCAVTDTVGEPDGHPFDFGSLPTAGRQVREMIQRRYELIPYIYSLHLENVDDFAPPIRWLGWGYESDERVWARPDTARTRQYWFGDSILVSPVSSPNVFVADVYCPDGQDGSDDGYFNLNPPYEYLGAGYIHEISAHWTNSIPVLAKVGMAIPIGPNVPTISSGELGHEIGNRQLDMYRGLEIFPPPPHVCRALRADRWGKLFATRYTWMEDDGITDQSSFAVGDSTIFVTLNYSVSACNRFIEVAIYIEHRGDWKPEWVEPGVHVILPVGDNRTVMCATPFPPEKCPKVEVDRKGRSVWLVKTAWEVARTDR